LTPLPFFFFLFFSRNSFDSFRGKQYHRWSNIFTSGRRQETMMSFRKSNISALLRNLLFPFFFSFLFFQPSGEERKERSAREKTGFLFEFRTIREVPQAHMSTLKSTSLIPVKPSFSNFFLFFSFPFWLQILDWWLIIILLFSFLLSFFSFFLFSYFLSKLGSHLWRSVHQTIYFRLNLLHSLFSSFFFSLPASYLDFFFFKGLVCENCGSQKTHRWRKGHGETRLCNMCYVRWLRLGKRNELPGETVVWFLRLTWTIWRSHLKLELFFQRKQNLRKARKEEADNSESQEEINPQQQNAGGQQSSEERGLSERTRRRRREGRDGKEAEEAAEESSLPSNESKRRRTMSNDSPEMNSNSESASDVISVDKASRSTSKSSSKQVSSFLSCFLSLL